MASLKSFDDNWQTIRPTICERTKFIFNNELLSDVKFVVPASHNESESRKSRKCMIPAHKFVLAITGLPESQQHTGSQIIRICMEIYLKIVERFKCTATEVFIPYKEFCLVFLLFPAL